MIHHSVAALKFSCYKRGNNRNNDIKNDYIDDNNKSFIFNKEKVIKHNVNWSVQPNLLFGLCRVNMSMPINNFKQIMM